MGGGKFHELKAIINYSVNILFSIVESNPGILGEVEGFRI